MNALQHLRTPGDVFRINASRFAGKPAVESLDGRSSVTFDELNTRVNRLNNAVGALGLTKGDRVAILSKNRPEYLEVFGLGKSGIVIVPLNWRLASAELERLARHSAPRILIADAAYQQEAERLRASVPGIEHLVLLDGATGATYEALLASAPAAEPDVHVDPDDLLCLIYTSGTTGDPKGVAVTHAGAIGNCLVAVQDVLGLRETDRTMAVMPLFHAGGMWYHLFPSFAAGCSTLLLSEFDPATVLAQLQARRITNVHLVPTMIGALLAHPSAAQTDLKALRLIFYAASSMPGELLLRALRLFQQSGFVQSYGSTEAGIITRLTPTDHRLALAKGSEQLLSSCGTPLPGREVRIVDDVGVELPVGVVGEVEVRSPHMMRGYWNDESATRKLLNNGWLKTGDLARLDPRGYLSIVDRKNDMVITGGENVYPTEVEAFLYRDPDVLEASVFGVPDPRWVERVVAAVVLRPHAAVSAEELIRRLRVHLAPYKCPKAIYLTDSLPKGPAGKVLRKELRRRYASRSDTPT